jgi:nicotinate-nucleotide adenylyltransferase
MTLTVDGTGENKAKRIGILGGTYNPIHFGHLRAAEEIFYHFQLDEIWFVPSAHPPHKNQVTLDFKHRLEMIKLAIKDRIGFLASDLEIHLKSPSYSVNTIKSISADLDKDVSLFFLVGYDSFKSIHKWHSYQELLALSSFIVFQRPGVRGSCSDMVRTLSKVAPEWEWDGGQEVFFLPQPYKPVYYYQGCRLIISSTDLRDRLSCGTSVRYLIPESVREYIHQHALYAEMKK